MKKITIWIDADACPVAIKEILFKAAIRTQTQCTLIANQFIKTPASDFINAVQVGAGFDVADNEIVLRANKDDLVITSDIPLAAEIIEKGAKALSPRGEMYDANNIKARLNMRDFMESMRSSGKQTSGPAPLKHSDRQRFANQLDRYLAKRR